MAHRMMKRAIVGMLMSTFVVGGTLALATSDADAQRRGRRGRSGQQQRAPQTPHSDAIAPYLGQVEWGWSRRQLVEYYTQKIREDYRERIAKARNHTDQDRLVIERNRAVQRLRRNVVRFDGRTTGYDSGFLRDEFTHNNNEEMVRVRGDNADDYFFFIDGKLWKWYHAFDASVFSGADWETFKTALARRFGEGLERTGKVHEHADERTWVEWQDDDTRARALDNTTFYGFYCLVFESRETLAQLDQLRSNAPRRRGSDSHALVDAVTGGGDDDETDDAHSDVVDRITGNNRRRRQAGDDD
jgi:hypothetical protein